MKMNDIHLAVAFDQNYITPFFVLATSIFENNKGNSFCFHVISTGVNSEEKQEIERFVQVHQSSIEFYTISPEQTAGLVVPEHMYFTLAAYYRLFFPALVPAAIDKLLYLDTDIVVIGNLAELYQTDVAGFPVGAVAEVRVTKSRPDLGLYEEGNYFNSGVMLINIPEWKKQQITEKAIQFVHDFPEKIVFVDQDALNVVIRSNYVKLNTRFNVLPSDIPKCLPKNQYGTFLKGKVIMHYTLKHLKPWNKDCAHKFRYLYTGYLQKSPRMLKKKAERARLSTRMAITILRIWAIEAVLNLPKVSAVVAKLVDEDIASFM